MQANPLEQVLEEYSRTRSELGITLRDGSYIRGRVKDFDGYIILLDGAPETIVYRHSILKLAAHEAPKTRPVVQAAARPEKRTAPRPDRQARPPRKEQPQRPQRPREEKAPVKEQGELSPMGEAMLKWLKSQKGGE